MPVMDNGIGLLIKITKAGDVPGSSLGDATRTQNVSEYMLVLALCLV